MIALVTIVALLIIWLAVYPQYQPTAVEMTAQAIRENNAATMPVYYVTATAPPSP
jgi:hypothetical protein